MFFIHAGEAMPIFNALSKYKLSAILMCEMFRRFFLHLIVVVVSKVSIVAPENKYSRIEQKGHGINISELFLAFFLWIFFLSWNDTWHEWINNWAASLCHFWSIHSRLMFIDWTLRQCNNKKVLWSHLYFCFYEYICSLRSLSMYADNSWHVLLCAAHFSKGMI